MRLISNKELVAVSGGASVEGSDQTVEVSATRMSWWEKIYYTIFEAGTGGNLSMSDWNTLQTAYVQANETGHPVQVEISSPQVTIGVEKDGAKIEATPGTTKMTVTVDPADCYKRP